MQVAAAHVTPAGMLAEQHRRMAEPNSGQESEEEAGEPRRADDVALLEPVRS